MVRNRQRTTNQQSWSEESMKQAIEAVVSKTKSYYSAAREYNVPLATLHRRTKKVLEGKTVEQATEKKLGRFRQVFTQKMEEELVEYLLTMEQRLFGLSFKELQHIAYEYVEKNSLNHPFNREAREAGKDFVYGFLRRNPTLSFRKPENTSAARAQAFNHHNVSEFFDLLEKLCETYLFSPSNIYNVDESGITTVPEKPTKIISLKGKKQVGVLSSGERGTLLTIEVCFNAAGNYIPPLFVFPRVRENPLFSIGLPPDSKVVLHSSGWMQKEIFAPVWFEHFIKHSKPSKDNPVLLIMDGHMTHTRNLRLVEMARQNHVHIITLPPHTTHRLQPLDVTFMFPLSTFYEQEVRAFLRQNPGKVVTITNISPLIGKAYIKAASSSTAIEGFRRTGIFPFDRHIFPEEAFAAAETTNHIQSQTIPVEVVDEHQLTVPANEAFATNIDDGITNENNVREEINIEVDAANIIENQADHQEKPTLESAEQNQSIKAHEQTTNIASNKNTPEANRIISNESCSFVSPFEIAPLPSVSQEKETNKRKRRTLKSTVLTSSPHVKSLLDFQENEENKKKASKSTAKKRLFRRKKNEENLDESTSAESVVYDDESDTPSEFEVSNDEDSSMKIAGLEKINYSNIKVGDFLKIKLKSDKTNKEENFASKVLDIEDGTVVVAFLRTYRNSKNTFIFPIVEDKSSIVEADVIGRYTSVNILRYGKIKFE